MSSLEPWLYSYPVHLHWEQTEPGEFLWDDVTTHACCRKSIKKGGPAKQHGICKEHSSGQGGLTIALKGRNCWMCRLLFFIFPWTIAFQSWKCYSCVHRWSTGMAAELPMGLYWFWTREKEDLLMCFGSLLVLLSLCYWVFAITPLKLTMLSDKKTSSATVWCLACFTLSLWEKEKYFGVGLPCNIQHNILDHHMMFPTSVKLWIILTIP